MPRTSTTRGEMIERLVEHSVNEAVSESHQHWLKEVFEKGFVGYSKLSNHQLLVEMHLRGLIPSEDQIEDEVDDEADAYAVPGQMFN